MKRMFTLCFICLLCISGCSHHDGSFEGGDVNMNAFFVDVNKRINDKKFNMSLLNDTPFTKSQIESEYKLDMTKVDECMVKSAVIPTQLSEIAIFKIRKDQEQYVKDAIAYRLKALEEMYGSYREEAKNIIHKAAQGRIGEYYYFVLGEDCEKVVNYMRNGA